MRLPATAALVFSSVLLVPFPAAAANLQVEPGLWEFRAEVPASITGGTEVTSQRACLREREVTAKAVMARIDQCRIWDLVSDGRAARWKIRCRTPVGMLPGQGALTSNGTAVTGAVDWTVAVGSMELAVTSRFRGKRIGECR